MSLYDKASLIMTPSGAKAEKLYSHKPHNGNGDFTHDRSAGTATRVNKDGYIETVAADVPRLNYPLIDGVVQDNPHFLLEPSRTNLLPNSQEYGINNTNTTTTRDVINAPDGTQTADRIVDNSVSGEHLFGYNISSSVVNGTTYSFSVFFKSDGSGGRGVIRWYSGSWQYAVFDLELGAVSYVTSGTATIENYGNGWYRCSFIITAIANYSPIVTQIGIANSSNNYIYAGASSLGVYFWGTQFEIGSYPTSYIPTSGTTVTRNADVCDSAGTSAEFNDSEGVLYAEIAALANDGNLRFITINDGNYTDRVAIAYTSSDNQLRLQVTVGGSDSYLKLQSINDAKEFNKISLKYKASDFVIWINGFEYHTQSSGSVFPIGTLDSLSFDNGAGGSPFYGKTKELAVFKEALTDSELEALTSWTSFNEMATGQEYTIR